MFWRTFLVVCFVIQVAAPTARSAETGVKGVQVTACEVTQVRTAGGRVPIVDDPVIRAALAGADLPGEWVGANLDETDERFRFSGRATHARLTVRSDGERVVMFHAQGHALLVDADGPRPGDPYGYGFWSLPVRLAEGDNELVVRLSGRGAFVFDIAEPVATVFFAEGDRTVFDPRRETSTRMPVGLAVVNATDKPVTPRLRVDGVEQALPMIAPMTRQQVPVMVHYDGGPTCVKRLELMVGECVMHEVSLDLPVRDAGDVYRRTFISGVDGSVQYYAVQPALESEVEAIVLSLHGASVEATNHARAYSRKRTWPIVCPTNRRPFGFDWEDWGRIDALEALADAREHFSAADVPTYLTGHSMGGHGVWNVAANTPGVFAALAPSAGWGSFDTYPPGARTLQRHPPAYRAATGTSDTYALLPNLDRTGVYVLHGDADDNVPPQQARDLAAAMRELHDDVVLDIRPGKGHWWDEPDTPGADCVDLAEMFAFLAERKPAGDEAFTLITANPSVSGRRGWLTVEQQQRPLQPSRVEAARSVDTVTLDTENVRRLTLDLPAIALVVDGTRLDHDGSGPAHILRDNAGNWTLVDPTPVGEKSAARTGPFKHAFDRDVLLVVGTGGQPSETAANAALARFHAESFAYRGNGTLRIVRDTDLADHDRPDRNVVLYGNADTNAAWTRLLPDTPVTVARNGVKVGDNAYNDAGVLLVRPKPDSAVALVGVVGADTPEAMRQLALVSVFVSGVSPPDWVVFDVQQAAIHEAGIFDNAWAIDD
ncbi:MAG: prolyl oligopeptidase family serine peptidase [Planctomycetota bacterium]